MNLLHATWFANAKKIASSFSLALLACLTWADVDYSRVKARLDKADSLAKKQVILRELASKREVDEDLQLELDQTVEAWDNGSSWSPEPVIEMIELRAAGTKFDDGVQRDAIKKQIDEIKKDPLYTDPGIEESSNWFSRAMQRLGELISNYFEQLRRRSEPQRSNVDPGGLAGLLAGLSELLKFVVFGILALLLGVFIYFVARHFHWKARIHRKATALMEDDEPERTLDEWLAQADKLIGEGKYREAVRCLYLACLLRFDEANVARFIRSQTNWEHLARIERSPTLPEGIEFREATQAFDRIWYGFRINGMEDVSRFRMWYTDLTALLGGKPR